MAQKLGEEMQIDQSQINTGTQVSSNPQVAAFQRMAAENLSRQNNGASKNAQYVNEDTLYQRFESNSKSLAFVAPEVPKPEEVQEESKQSPAAGKNNQNQRRV